MSRFIHVAAALALGAATAGAQSLAQRIAAAGQGEVRMTYSTRADVCGDGGSTIGVADAFMMSSSMESYGRWTSTHCRPGAARVAVEVGADGVASVQPHVGGSWQGAEGRVVDLGVVSAPEAASYFLDIAEKLDGRAARNTLLAAVIADSADMSARLLAIGERTSNASETRRRAVHWLGVFGNASMVKPLTELAKTGGEEKKSIADAALFALSRLPDGAGLPSLIELARSASSTRSRAQAVFWLGQSDDKRARSEVRAIAGDANAPTEVRERAVFSLGHSEAATAEDFRFLRELFARADSRRMQDQILMAMSQSGDKEGRQWLLSVARDENAPVESRKKAIFWAGQGGVPTADIAGIYDAVSNRTVREHTIFVLSQRDDKAATEKLMSIVNGNGDPELRKKALFWLGQKDDPAVTKAISDLVMKP